MGNNENLPMFGENEETYIPEDGHEDENLNQSQEQDDNAQTEDSGSETEHLEDGAQDYAGHKDVDDLVKAHKHLEAKLTQTAQENALFKQQLAYLQTLLQQQSQTPTQQQQEEVDPDEWLDKLSREGPAAVEEVVQKILGEKLQPIEGFVSQQAQKQKFDNKFAELASKYQDFIELVPLMKEIGATLPGNLSQEPEGMEVAYQLAKAKKLEQDLVGKQKQKQQTETQKQAAGIFASASRRPSGNAPNPDDLIKQSIFGNPSEKQGIFD